MENQEQKGQKMHETSKKENEKDSERNPNKKIGGGKSESKKERIVVVNGKDLRISLRHAVDICKMIRGKRIEESIDFLEDVTKFKKVIKMGRREVGHKHGKGIMAGGYPIRACKEFIRLLKQLKANATALEIEPMDKIIFCKADVAAKPYRRGGTRAKRAHILLRLEEKKHRGT